MFVKVPQDNGFRYFEFKCLTGAQIVDESVIFFMDDDSVFNVTFVDVDTAEEVVDDMIRSSMTDNFYEIYKEDVVEVVNGEYN